MSFLGAQNSIALGVQGIIAIDTGTGTIAVVTDPYWPFVSTLLHGDGVNGGQNNTFLDGSTNNFTVTRNGNTTQGSFNPFVPTYPYSVATNGGSGYFNGTTDWLTLPSITGFGTSNWTIEGWVNTTGSASAQVIVDYRTTVQGFYPVIYISTDNKFAWYINITEVLLSSIAITNNTWNHFAFVKNGSTTTVYVNGVSGGTYADSNSYLGNTPTISASGLTADSHAAKFSGYISNLRIVNGTAVYTTNFTPPTAPLTAVTNTALLLGMSNGAIYDNTMLNNLETVGNAQINTSVFKYGTGSMKFDGTGDYLTVPSNAAFDFGSGNFTVEFWINTTQTTFNATLIVREWGSVPNTGGWGIQLNGNLFSPMTIYWADFSTSVPFMVAGTTSYRNGSWHHVAWVRNGTAFTLYIDGVVEATATSSTAFGSTSNALTIANDLTFGPREYLGYIDDLRITKGIARYTATFTPPTAAFPNS